MRYQNVSTSDMFTHVQPEMYITRISNYLLIIKLITVDIHSNGNFEIAQWITQTRLKLDQISDVMFRMFTSSVVDRGFEPLSGKTCLVLFL
jgi:hypothetical protein